MVSVTLAPASAMPAIAVVSFSAALIRSSPATVAIVGGSGNTVSTRMTRSAAPDTLPATSVARTDNVSKP